MTELTAEDFRNAVTYSATDEAEEIQTQELQTEVVVEEKKEVEVVDATKETEVTKEAQTENTVTEAGKEPTFFEKLQKKEVSATTVDYEAKAKELEELVRQKDERIKYFEDSPIAKLAELTNGEYDLTKVDLKQLAKQMAGEDFTKYELKDLLKMDLKAKYPNMSDEKIALGVEDKLGKMSEWDQEAERESIAQRLSENQNPSDVFAQLKKVQDSQIEAQNQPSFQEQIIQRVNATVEKFSKLGENLVDQEYLGYKAVKEDADAIVNMFKQDTSNFDEDKKYVDYFKIVTYEKFGDAREELGYQRGLKEKTNANAHNSGASVIVTRDSEKKGLSGATAADFANAEIIG